LHPSNAPWLRWLDEERTRPGW